MSTQTALPLTAPGAAAPAASTAAPVEGAPASATAPPAKKEESTPAKANEGILGGTGEAKKQQEGETREQDGEQPKPAGELEIKLPEGMEVDPVTLKEFSAKAKELGVSAEQASNLIAWDHARNQAAVAAQEKQQQAQHDTWAKEIEADPEIGGAKLTETGMFARRAIRAYGGEPLAKFFAESGLSNHPTLVRAFRAVGAAMGEDDSAVAGGGNKPVVSDAKAQLMKEYPSMFNEDGTEKLGGR